MFTTLMESRAVRVRNTGGTAVSAALHAVLISAAIATTTLSSHPLAATPLDPPPVRFVAPAVEAASTRRARVPTGAPASLPAPARPPLFIVPDLHVAAPALVLDGPPVPVDRVVTGGGGLPPAAPGLGIGTLPGPGDVIDAAYVERAPRMIGNPPSPRYPDALRASGISGQVVARFVVDTSGRAEMEGLTMPEASHPLFADAVRAVLARYRFAPGEVGGRKVRTMVQLPFSFTVK